MTSGIVSALDRTIIVETNKPINMFQIDAAINSGNSGGPVFNSRGQVIGIASAKYSSAGVEGLGFAVSINVAMKSLNDLKQYGYVKGRPLFGISVYTATEVADGVKGAIVATGEAGSCSEKAGILVGDIITALNDIAVASSSDLIAAKKNFKAGETVSLTILRKARSLRLM
jgi:serine protease Do